MIPHSRPTIDEKDALAVAEVVRSGLLAQGEKVRSLEEGMALCSGKRHAAAVSSGTAALHLSLESLGIGREDFVALPSFACSALLHSVGMTGAAPLLIDIDASTLQMDLEDLRKRITKKTRAIILPHAFGFPVDPGPFLEFGVPVIEDCAQAIGARLRENPVGSFGAVSVFSFYATKVLAAGEGGMVCSDSEEIILKVRDLREYDNKEDFTQRFNYKMTDIHAALGLSQLKRIDRFIERRRKIAQIYEQSFSSLPLILPRGIPQGDPIYFRYVIQLPEGMEIEKFIRRMRQKGIVCMRPVFKPLHHLLKQRGFPGTDTAWKRSVSVPIYPGLRGDQITTVIEAIKGFFG